MSTKQSVRLLLMVFAFPGFIATARAQLDEEKIENVVLPDSFYIAARCDEPRKILSSVRKDKALLAKVDMKASEALAGEMTAICDRARKKQISADDWLQQFEEKSAVLEKLTDRCGKTAMCMKMIVPPAQPIPNDFKAYSLFLFPSAEWNTPEHREDLKKIQEAFSAFGDSIGNRRAAIWFSENVNSSTPDIARSKYFADLFGLNYNDGPYIVTSLKRPDEIAARDQLVIIKLGAISSPRVVKILNLLEPDLRTDSVIRNRTLIFEEVKQRLLSAADRNPEIAKELTKGAISLITK